MNVTRWNGEPIAAPGLYSGVPMSAYHGQLTVGPSVSRSGLWKIFDASPAHYFVDSYLNPNREPPDEAKHFVLGRAAHHLVLGESDFRENFVIRPDEWDSWRTKDAKAWRIEQWKGAKGVLEPSQIDAVKGMARGLSENALVRAGILNGLIEHSLVWQDEETGVWLKIRPDAIPTDSMDFSDFKTCADISDDGLVNAIGRDGLNLQGAMVAMGCRALFGKEMNSFTLVFAEKTAPYCVRVKTLSPEDLTLGEDQVRIALKVFARCLERGEWPGPGGAQTDAEYISMRTYARERAQTRIATLAMELEQAA